jgi:hypothetical protein
LAALTTGKDASAVFSVGIFWWEEDDHANGLWWDLSIFSAVRQSVGGIYFAWVVVLVSRIVV